MNNTSPSRVLPALLAVLFTDSCRDPIELECERDCVVSHVAGSGGGGGQGAHDQTGAPEAGVGGEPAAGAPAVSTPQCRKDADCDDGSFCNGAEACRDDACESGTPVDCAAQTECVENGDGAGAGCRVPESERFFLCSSGDFDESFNSVGFPLTRVDPVPQNFSDDLDQSEFKLVVDSYDRHWMGYDWSPNGRRAIFRAYAYTLGWDMYEEKLYYVDSRAPIESRPRRLPDIPISENVFGVASWSADGNALVLSAHDYSLGRDVAWFAVRFTDAGGESAALPGRGVAFICADNATVAVNAGNSTRLFQPWNAGSSERVLPMNAVSISPDGKTLLLSDASYSALAPCSVETELEILGGFGGPSAVGSWSSDSRYVITGDSVTGWGDDPSPKHLLGYPVRSEQIHGVLFEATAADPRVLFEPGSARFVFVQQADADEPPVWRSADLDDDTADLVLPVPPGIATAPELNDYVSAASWLGHGGALRFWGDAGPLLLPVAPGGVLRAGRGGVFSEDGSRELWTEQELVDGATSTQAYSLRWSEPDALPEALFSKPFAGSLTFMNALVLESYDEESETAILYSLPPGADAPVRLNRGSNATNCSLQPAR